MAIALLLASRATLRSTTDAWRQVSIGEARVTAFALPAKGASVVVAAGAAGYVVRDPKRPARIPMERVTGVAVGVDAPDLIVAVGRAKDGGNLRFSVDGGDSWRPGPTASAIEGGSVALSSDGRTWVWAGSAGGLRSDDYGFHWTSCEGLPGGARVVADPTSFRRFYAMASGHLLVSDDGARSFDERELGLPPAAADDVPLDVVPTPGRADDLWLLTTRTLYRAPPGKPFARVPGVADPRSLAFGQSRHHAYPGNPSPTLFLAATIEGRTGLFRSADEAATWFPIAGAPPVSTIAALAGDPKRYGRVYVSLAEGGLVFFEGGR